MRHDLSLSIIQSRRQPYDLLRHLKALHLVSEMVYFVCETCNETLKKAQVDKHVYTCRNCWGVTCVDCNQTFEGDAYRVHTSCVSEDQKYQGALYKAPKTKNKHRGAQEIWTDAVARAASAAANGEAPKAVSGLLSRMGCLGNVPRQEKKFKNFVKNSLRVYDDGTIGKLWDYLEGMKDKINQEEKNENIPNEVPAITPARPETPAKQGTKRRREDEKGVATASGISESGARLSENGGHVEPAGEESPRSNGDVDTATRKMMVKAAIAILKQAPNKELAVKRLVKRAVTTAREQGGVATGMDDKELRRALKRRLLNGLRRVTVVDEIATYTR